MYNIDPKTNLFRGLSQKFVPFADKIKTLPAAFFKIQPNKATFLQSKVGGTPYFPPNALWPLGRKNQPLGFLAQINCAEFEQIEGFPKSGILQFFVDPDDEFYGSFEQDNKIYSRNFRVLFHPKPIMVQNSIAMPNIDQGAMPISCEDSRIKFERGKDFPPSSLLGPDGPFSSSKRFSPFLGINGEWNEIILAEKMKQEYENAITYINHPKIGGFPCFFNGHPGQLNSSLYQYDRLLFQLPSGRDIMFGDCGTAVFMIKKDALLQLDFSEVFFSIDA